MLNEQFETWYKESNAVGSKWELQKAYEAHDEEITKLKDALDKIGVLFEV